MSGNISINGGGLFAKNAGTQSESVKVADVTNIKGQLTITSMSKAQENRGNPQYFISSWSDLGA
jgi:FAD/FMN-containing dehydrogenase